MNIPKQRLAVVTGASAGIGAEIARQLLDAGWAVVSMARRPPPFTHQHLHSVEVDLADRAATAAAAEDVAQRFAPDTVIHNAGVILPALLADVKLSDLDTLVDIHLSTAILLAQACLPAMKAAGFCRIVLLSSRGALGLATPTALLVGTGRGAQLGLLIKGPEVLESTRTVDTIVLDKTGTVTSGEMSLHSVALAPGADRAEVLRIAGALENASEHPIARAIAAAATEAGGG